MASVPKGAFYDDDKERIAPNTYWEATPKWMFWKPTMRRIVVKSFNGCYGSCCNTEFYEYQHPAFVAREVLENAFAPKT